MCESLFKLLKKDTDRQWDDQCQQAFEKVKQYLANSPILAPPHCKKSLTLYLTITETAVGAMLAQEKGDTRAEDAIYFVSRKLQGSELNYSSLEKSCASLVWVSQRLKMYLQSLPVKVVSRMDPVKYILEKPSLSNRLAKWAFLLNEFDMTYTSPKTIKRRVIADQLADFPLEDDGVAKPEFPDEGVWSITDTNKWQMFFDGTTNKR